jgi:hypothetical protein
MAKLTLASRKVHSKRRPEKIRLRILLHSHHAAAAVVVVEGRQLVLLRRQCLRVLVVGLPNRTRISLGSLWRKIQVKRLVFSSPLGHVSSITAISFDGFLPPRAGIWNSGSAFFSGSPIAGGRRPTDA